MKNLLNIAFLSLLVGACDSSSKEPKHSSTAITPEEQWKLEWRMVSSAWDDNLSLGEKQFDSLLATGEEIKVEFLLTGLEILEKAGKQEKLVEILGNQSQQTLQELCTKNLFTDKLPSLSPCQSVKGEAVSQPELQREFLRMYIDDQTVRGNMQESLIAKYKLEAPRVARQDGLTVDARNRKRLQELIAEFGFPTKEMVGADAMRGVFLIIQHSDSDKGWQRSQLVQIEESVKKGDLDGQSYALLYDRIKVNAGEAQRYGTQFSRVDPVNKTVELAETEEIEHLDSRRMEIGMMPIEMYKQYMLKNM